MTTLTPEPSAIGTITLGRMNRHCRLHAEHGWTMTAANVAGLLGLTPKELYDLRRERKDDLRMGVHLTKMRLTQYGDMQIVWTRAGTEAIAGLLKTARAREVKSGIGQAVPKIQTARLACAREQAMSCGQKLSAGEVAISANGERYKAYLDTAHRWVMPCATVASMLGFSPAELREEKSRHPKSFVAGVHLVRHGKRDRFYWTRDGVIRLCLLSRKKALQFTKMVLLKQ